MKEEQSPDLPDALRKLHDQTFLQQLTIVSATQLREEGREEGERGGEREGREEGEGGRRERGREGERGGEREGREEGGRNEGGKG